MMRTVMLSAVAATAMIIASPVLAQSEEEKIRDLVQTIITDMSGGDADAMGMKWDGEITVTPADGGFYLARLPSLSVMDPQGSGVEVGVIAMNVRARPDQDYDLAIAMPDPMYVVENSDRVAEIKIGGQQLFARWSSEVSAMRTVKLDWRDLTFTGIEEGEEAVVKMEQIALDTDNMPADGGMWNNTFAFTMNNITADSPEGARVFTLGKFAANANTNNYDYPAFVRFNRKMQEVQAKMANPEALAGDPQAQQTIMSELSDTIKNAGQILGTDFTSRIELDTVRIADDGGEEGGGIDRVLFQLGMNSLTEENANLELEWLYNGLSMTPAEDHHKLLPRRSDGSIKINDIPTSKLVSTATGSLDSMAAGGPPPMMALFQVPVFFGQAGTTFNIESANAGGDLLGMTSSGRFYMSEELAMSSVFIAGKLTANISGIDRAIAEITGSEDRQMKEAMGPLQMLRELGVDNGNDNRSFEIELTADGRQLINGKSVDEVMGGGMEEPAPQ